MEADCVSVERVAERPRGSTAATRPTLRGAARRLAQAGARRHLLRPCRRVFQNMKDKSPRRMRRRMADFV
eukprot:1453365-Pyramimonas_sp.AAC.1